MRFGPSQVDELEVSKVLVREGKIFISKSLKSLNLISDLSQIQIERPRFCSRFQIHIKQCGHTIWGHASSRCHKSTPQQVIRLVW
jgi:hypothetical protein